MNGINKVILIGHLGGDPEMKIFESGAKKTTFTLATTERFKNKQGEIVKQTEWHRIYVWKRLAEIAKQYLKKGSQVYIEGKLKTRKYEDKAGIERYVTEIEALNLQMLSKKEETKPDNVNHGQVQGDKYQEDLPY